MLDLRVMFWNSLSRCDYDQQPSLCCAILLVFRLEKMMKLREGKTYTMKMHKQYRGKEITQINKHWFTICLLKIHQQLMWSHLRYCALVVQGQQYNGVVYNSIHTWVENDYQTRLLAALHNKLLLPVLRTPV